MHSGDKASPIFYFTLLVGEHSSHEMINRTLEHVHHTRNVLMISSLLIVIAYILTSLTHTFLKAKFKTFSRVFSGVPIDIFDTFKQHN